MPMIRLCFKLIRVHPAAGLNPEECVAIGGDKGFACSRRKGGSRPVYLNHKEGLPLKLSDRNATSHSFGFVVLKDGKLHNSIVIPKNSLYPCEKAAAIIPHPTPISLPGGNLNRRRIRIQLQPDRRLKL